MIINYKEHGFEIRARILPEACTECPFYLYSVSCDDAACFLTGSGIPTDGPQDEGRAPDCPIKALEPIWIPCSERLPEEDGHYIVYAPSYSGGSSSGKEIHNGVMFSRFKSGKWSIEVGYHKRPNCVKAWMPIDPWKGESDGSC